MLKKCAKYFGIGLASMYGLHMFYIVTCSPVKLSDITSDRISLLEKDHDKYDKTIVLDVTKTGTVGGMAMYAKEIIYHLIESYPRYRWIIVDSGNFNRFYINKKYLKDDNVISVNSKFAPANILYYWWFFITKTKMFSGLDYKFSKWLSKQSPRFNDIYYRIKQVLCFNQIFVDRHVDLIFSLMTPSSMFGFGIPQISVNHDVIHLDKPDIVSRSSLLSHKRYFVNNFNYSTKIISISDFTKDCIEKYFEGISDDRICVIKTQLGKRLPEVENNIQLSVLKKFNLEQNKYCVFASAVYKHKNHIGLVRAFAEMLEKHKDIDKNFKLVFMGHILHKGKLHPLMKEVLDTAKQLGIDSKIVLTGFTTNEEFASVMLNCLFVVNPTFYEGFGMPIAEAMALHKPVVCSKVASLPEVGGDAALYFDPYNISDIAEKLYMAYSNQKLREELVAKGDIQVQQFTHKEQFFSAIKKLLEDTMNQHLANPYEFNWKYCYIK